MTYTYFSGYRKFFRAFPEQGSLVSGMSQVSATSFFLPKYLIFTESYYVYLLIACLTYSRTSVSCVLTCSMPTCLSCLRAHLPTCLPCSRAHVQRALCAYVLTWQLTLLAYVLTCWRALYTLVCWVPPCSCPITAHSRNKFSMTCLLRFLVLFLCLFHVK